MADQIQVSAVVLRDDRGRVLTVRKRGTEQLMFPGGKPDPGESDMDTAVRECAEEIGVRLDRDALRRIGTFTAPAANESGRLVRAAVFAHPPVTGAAPRAEIAQLEWVDPAADDPRLAPLLRAEVFPALRRPPLDRVTVFTGSAAGTAPGYADAAADFARTVVAGGRGIVYGGGKVGLMGVVADTAIEAGGEVVGVMPRALVDREIAHRGLSRLEVVADMHARKHRMAELGDGFVALPGGAGTLEELFEAWTWLLLGVHSKPVALLDVDGFWQPLLHMLDRMAEQGFLSPVFRDALIVDADPDALLTAMTRWEPPAPKWSGSAASTPPEQRS